MKINDPAAVVRQYATEKNLEARRSLYENAVGPDPRYLLPLRSRRATSIFVATR